MVFARLLPACLLTAGALSLVAGTAAAHFELQSPPAAFEQDPANGNPQKTAPCGDGGAAVATGVVTTYQQGETITITIDEKIYHPGHYRVALALTDPNDLPAAPPITPDVGDECASTVIQNPPVFPVLADGELTHNATFGVDNPQSFQVTLPDDVTCDNCTLQVIQYMSSHNAPCFYYHCANIAIEEPPPSTSAATTTTSSTGSGNGGSGGMPGTGAAGGTGGDGLNNNGTGGAGAAFGSVDDGCTCSTVGAGGGAGWLALFGFAGVAVGAMRRRRR